MPSSNPWQSNDNAAIKQWPSADQETDTQEQSTRIHDNPWASTTATNHPLALHRSPCEIQPNPWGSASEPMQQVPPIASLSSQQEIPEPLPPAAVPIAIVTKDSSSGSKKKPKIIIMKRKTPLSTPNPTPPISRHSSSQSISSQSLTEAQQKDKERLYAEARARIFEGHQEEANPQTTISKAEYRSTETDPDFVRGSTLTASAPAFVPKMPPPR